MITFRQFLIEQISVPETKSVAEIVTSILGHKYQIYRVVLARDVMSGNPKISEIDVNTGTDKANKPKPLFNSDVVFRNYRAVFGKAADSLSHAEVLKFEFGTGMEWFMLLLGFTQDGKKGVHMAFKPGVGDFSLMSTIGNYLKGQGYVIFPQMTQTEKFKGLGENQDFIYKLIEIFRPAAGMSFQKGMWTRIYKEFEKLKAIYPQEWAEMQKVKKEVYGNTVKATRKMDGIPSLTVVETNKNTPTSKIKPGTKVYYPLGLEGLYFSQWSDGEDVHPDDAKLAHKANIPSQGEQIFECNVPVDRIIVGHRMMPAAGSTQVFEREIVVSHPPAQVEAKSYDPGLICTLVTNSAYEG